MVDRDAQLGNKTINEHKENVVNIKMVVLLAGREAGVIGMEHLARLPWWLATFYDTGGGPYGFLP